MIDALNTIDRDLTEDQQKLVIKHFESYFRYQMIVHCEYWLKNKFIPFDDYFEIRRQESGYNNFSINN